MPLFDYKCTECGHVIEKLVTSFDMVVQCEICGVATVRQPSAPASLIIKGFSSVNGYSRTDTGWQKSIVPGIKTRVQDGTDRER